MVALCFEETTVNAEQTQFVQDRAGLFRRFTSNGLDQSLACLHPPARQISAIRVGVLDKDNVSIPHGKEANSNG